MKIVFKIWDSARKSKKFVAVENTENLLPDLLSHASQKLNIMDRNGLKLLLECDGTEIDEDSITLEEVQNKVLLLLTKDEEWQPAPSCRAPSPESTLTAPSTSSFASTQSDLNSSRSSTEHDNSVTENTWVHFSVPWNKLTNSTIDSLEKESCDKQVIRRVVNLVVESMVEVSKDIPNKVFNIMAHKLVSKYPKSFQDYDDDGVVIGSGLVTICLQLKERYKYLKACAKRKSPCDSPSVPLSKRKKLLSAKAGCLDWQPAVTNSPDDEVDSKNALKNVNFNAPFEENVILLLENTYPDQRHFINKMPPPTIQEIRNEWPILLTLEGVCLHFKRLMGKDIEDLLQNLLSKSDKIIRFGKKKKIIDHIPSNDKDRITCVLKVLSKNFGETLEEIYTEVEGDIDIQEIVFPRIVATKENDCTTYVVVMEQQKIQDTPDLGAAFKMIFALYFIMNLEFPKKAAVTLECIQYYFLKIFPQQGSKNLKKNSQAKITSFLNRLKNF